MAHARAILSFLSLLRGGKDQKSEVDWRLNSPPVVCFQEPTGNLGNATERWLDHRSRGRPVIGRLIGKCRSLKPAHLTERTAKGDEDLGGVEKKR